MVKKLRMNAYYYGFTETGVREIDEILSAVACAGKSFHDTEYWAEPTLYGDGKSEAERIQVAADRAAKKLGGNGYETH